MQKQQQRKQREESKVDRDWSEDRQSQHPPSYRSRSYSDTDVNYHLNKEVGRELRRISDEFHFTYKGRQLLGSE
nr:hypothetical protein BaRGS_018311 [Batillaria attramentaria]